MYNVQLHGKFYSDIDVASGSCRVRNEIIRKWKECGDLGLIIDQTIQRAYADINVKFLLDIKKRYEMEELNEN